MDLAVVCTVSRSALGLGELSLNDHVSYRLAAESFSQRGQQWDRAQAGSPYLDGKVTVNRTRQMTTETVSIEVLGTDGASVQAGVNTVRQAFNQAKYALTLSIGSAFYQFSCETADVTETWSTSRWVADQLYLTFAVPVQPKLLAGGDH